MKKKHESKTIVVLRRFKNMIIDSWTMQHEMTRRANDILDKTYGKKK